ncbi:TPA: hypothetical protein ACH3X2_011664 [Trebouxia sp. C0005]
MSNLSFYSSVVCISRKLRSPRQPYTLPTDLANMIYMTCHSCKHCRETAWQYWKQLQHNCAGILCTHMAEYNARAPQLHVSHTSSEYVSMADNAVDWFKCETHT